jgi:anti-anti-sigma factor
MMLVREVQRSAGVWVLHVQGPIRVPVNRDLRHRVQSLLHRGAHRILVNLSGVWDLDAGGVGELVRLYNLARKFQRDLRIAEATPWARELLDRAGLFQLLSIESDQRTLKAV